MSVRLGIGSLAIIDYVDVIDEGTGAMGSVTIRNLDDAVKRNARLSAAANGRSLEGELRALLEKTYSVSETKGESSIQRLIRLGQGLNLEIPPREHEDIDFPSL